VLPSNNDNLDDSSDLVIFSPHPVDMTEYIVREFRQRTGIKVEVITGGTGNLITKLRNPATTQKADIFWGGGIESLETITDLFQEYTSSEQEAIENSYISSHRLWSPFSVLPVVIIYNTKLVARNLIPCSWSRLLDPYFRNHLLFANPVTTGSGFTSLVTMLRTMAEPGAPEGEGWPFVRSFMFQLGEAGLIASSTTVYKSVAEGAFFAGVTFENSALALKMAGKDIDFCYPAEGTSAVPDGIALIKDARHPDEAKRFIDFVLGRDVQSILMSKWYRRSVRTDIPSNQPNMADLNIIDYPIAESAAKRTQILDRWTQEYSRFHP
ncbi:MAG: iron ABC transporter substrate-binding protein, partial [Spirochaetae bacterium HGW-Spirochaetae-9]